MQNQIRSIFIKSYKLVLLCSTHTRGSFQQPNPTMGSPQLVASLTFLSAPSHPSPIVPPTRGYLISPATDVMSSRIPWSCGGLTGPHCTLLCNDSVLFGRLMWLMLTSNLQKDTHSWHSSTGPQGDQKKNCSVTSFPSKAKVSSVPLCSSAAQSLPTPLAGPPVHVGSWKHAPTRNQIHQTKISYLNHMQ